MADDPVPAGYVNLEARVSITVVLQHPTIASTQAPVYVLMQTASNIDPGELAQMLIMVKQHCDMKLKRLASKLVDGGM